MTLGEAAGRIADELIEARSKIASLEAEVARLRAMVPQWVPVSERMPDPPESIVFLGAVYRGVILPFRVGANTKDFAERYGYTHWAYLPEACR